MNALPIGADNFQNIINNDCYYIDKTDIEDLLKNKTGIALFPNTFEETLRELQNLISELYVNKKYVFDILEENEKNYISK